MAKGAGMLAPGAGHDARRPHHGCRSSPASIWMRRSARRRRPPSTASTPTGACRPTTPSLLMASGAAGVTRRPRDLTAAVTEVCASLARQLIADAEGAAPRHRHRCASLPRRGRCASRSPAPIARNNLFKCAVFGDDPNWGRILAAVGTTRAAFDPHAARRRDERHRGMPRRWRVGEDRSLVDLDRARGARRRRPACRAMRRATVWTNDLTHDYVHENSAYST
jgi:glutamate N-acetyltransferase/amino-acid N-acetyltransferase